MLEDWFHITLIYCCPVYLEQLLPFVTSCHSRSTSLGYDSSESDKAELIMGGLLWVCSKGVFTLFILFSISDICTFLSPVLNISTLLLNQRLPLKGNGYYCHMHKDECWFGGSCLSGYMCSCLTAFVCMYCTYFLLKSCFCLLRAILLNLISNKKRVLVWKEVLICMCLSKHISCYQCLDLYWMLL